MFFVGTVFITGIGAAAALGDSGVMEGSRPPALCSGSQESGLDHLRRNRKWGRNGIGILLVVYFDSTIMLLFFHIMDSIPSLGGMGK